jgi:hypothetical protein
MHPIPSPRSTSDAPAFDLTTPLRAPEVRNPRVPRLAPESSPTRSSAGCSTAARRSRTSSPAADSGVVSSSATTRSLTGSPSPFIRATVSRTPAASHISNGPSSQLKPAFMARSIETASPATSPIRSAAKFHSEDRNGHRNFAALSFAGSLASSSFSRSFSVAAFLAISSAGSAGLPAGRYSNVDTSSTRRASLPSAPLALLVEALSGLVAQPAALHHLLQHFGKSAVRSTLRKIRRHMRQNVDAHHIRQRNVPVRGQPIADPVSASTSSIVSPCSSIS